VEGTTTSHATLLSRHVSQAPHMLNRAPGAPVVLFGNAGASSSASPLSSSVVGAPKAVPAAAPTAGAPVVALGTAAVMPSVPPPSSAVVGASASALTGTPSAPPPTLAVVRAAAATQTVASTLGAPVVFGHAAAAPSPRPEASVDAGVRAAVLAVTPAVGESVDAFAATATTSSAPPPSPSVVGAPAVSLAATPTICTPVVAVGATTAMPPLPPSSSAVVGEPAAALSRTPTTGVPLAASGATAATPSAPGSSPTTLRSAGIVAATPAATLAASSAAAAQAGARAESGIKALLLHRLGRYVNAVNGGRVADKVVADLAAVVACAGRIEDAESGLQLVIHLSGVSPSGQLGWASIYGDGAYVDPDVLRVCGQVHQFCRGRDALMATDLPVSGPPARLVGIHHRNGVQPSPRSPAPIAPSVDDLEFMDATLAPQLDGVRPPPVDIQRLARLAARARSASASRSASPPSEGMPNETRDGASASVARSGRSAAGASGAASRNGTDDGGGPSAARVEHLLAGFGADGLMPFVLETLRPPKPHVPSLAAIDFMARIFLNRRAPITLLRGVLQAAVLFFAMRFKKGLKVVNEGFARWWAHQLILEQTVTGELPEKDRWPLGVIVPVRFLQAKVVSKLPPAKLPLSRAAAAAVSNVRGGAEEASDTGEDNGDDVTTHVTRAADKATEPAAVIELQAIPTDEVHCRSEHAVAAIMLLWDKEPTVRSIVEAEVFRTDRQAAKRKTTPRRKAPAKPKAAALVSGGAPALAPRPLTGAGHVDAASQVEGGSSGTSAVILARAAARSAACGSAAAPPATLRAAEATAKRSLDAPSAAGRAKRGRFAAPVGGSGALTNPPAVVNGPCDLLDATGVTIATGVADVDRKMLHTRAVPPHLVVVQVTGVAQASAPYAFEQDFPVEPPGEPHRSMGETVGCFIAWARSALLSV